MPQNPNQTATPWRFPAFRLLALAAGLGCSWLGLKMWEFAAGPLPAFYLPAYVRLSVTPSPLRAHFTLGKLRSAGTAFPILFVGRTVATEALLPHLSGAVSVHTMTVDREEFYGWLKTNIYSGKSPMQALRKPLYFGETILVIFFLIGWHFDSRQRSKARKGKLLRGPSLISRWRFNWQTRGDGLAFRLENRRNLLECLQGDAGRLLRIRRDRESHHIQIAGDTGSGKSTLIRELLYQIEARENEVAIVFDPDREYIQEFFREERGDWVLNPKDNRCPYWPIGDEATDEADATPVALGLFPDDPTLLKFFLTHTRAIFAYLLARYKPTVNELAFWMAHPDEIDKRVKGTEHEHTLTANAAPQRAGILGSLNEAGKPLRMMPSPSEGRRVWTAKQWAEQRKGWIFITSTPDTIDALRPLQSLWLDMLILKLQATEREPGQARVWMVMDELASLNALPQLHSALTKQRKSDNPIVLGFQGMSQLDALYGKKAETILSQAFTNIILRTREPRGSEHLSKLIGKAQLERLRETTPARWFQRNQGSFNTERVIDPVVMDSQIQGLDDLNGYFVQRDKIVAIRFGLKPKRNIAPGLIERIIPTAELRPLDPANPGAKPAPETTTAAARKPRPKRAKDQVLQQHTPDMEVGIFN